MAQVATSGSWVTIVHVGRSSQRCRGFEAGPFGQGEDLKARAIKSDEVLIDQGVAICEIIFERALQDGADRVVVVEAQAVTISNEKQEEIELKLTGAQGSQEAVTKETVRDKGKALFGDRADFVGADGVAGWGGVHVVFFLRATDFLRALAL